MSKPAFCDGRLTIDIRLFAAMLTVAICGAFFGGLTTEPSDGSFHSLSQVLHREDRDLFPPDLSAPKEELSPMNESLTTHKSHGQHLLVDIAEVDDSDFLDSEERLLGSMIQAVQDMGLSMSSHHCHELSPSGISCVGLLMEDSHISFHTCPEEGVVTVDLFTSMESPLIPHAVQTIESMFGFGGSARVKWSHELRGIRPGEHEPGSLIGSETDLSTDVLSPLDVHTKRQLYSNLTKYRRVDIWEVMDLDEGPDYQYGLKHGLTEGDPRWENPELATPDRCTFINGDLWRCSDDTEIEEGLVHPAMFAHPGPQHVAIIGGHDGGALREVLKHNTIQSVSLIEKDKELVKISQHYYPNLADCSDLIGRADNCFDDELTTVHYEDAREYFKSHYPPENTAGEALFDIIIVDDMDPGKNPEKYTDSDFVSSLIRALSPDGVMVMFAGMAPDIGDPRPDMGHFSVREQLVNELESDPQVKAILAYEEPRSTFDDPAALLVICKSDNCRSRWYARSDQVDFAIHERIVQTHSKDRALRYYDGTTQFGYQATPKAWETTYCLREPTPFECAYINLDPTRELHDLVLDKEESSSFRIQSESTVVKQDNGEEKDELETRVFAKVDIPKGSYIMPSHLANSLVVTERNLQGLYHNMDVGDGPIAVIEDLLDFIGKYGHSSRVEGTGIQLVEMGGSVLIRQVEDPDEANVGRWVPPRPSGKNPVFSPVYERHRIIFDVFIVATKDIPAGAEVVRHSGLWGNN